MKASAAATPLIQIDRKTRRKKTLRLMKRNYMLYLFLLPALAFIIIFCYGPMYGLQLAFKSFIASKGIWGSPWVGMKWFNMFFSSSRFWELISNTVLLSVYSLAAGFPLPIILALLLNSIDNIHFKKVTQTITYMPHFISVVVLVGMMSAFLSPNYGFINTFIEAMGGTPKYFMGDPKWFRHLYVLSGIWQETGWNSIIYIAALSGVNPELHESAMIDGASRIKRIWHIDLPAILPTIVILLILNFGQIMNVGFEKTFLMQNDLNNSVSEVISTYTYKIGLVQAEISYSTAIGLFNNLINFILLLTVNKISRKASGYSLW
jgi:putative aldouronate transport system permease protein